MLEFRRASVDNIALSIALSIGYADVGGFRRVFRKIVGLTPSDYRRRFSRRGQSGDDPTRQSWIKHSEPIAVNCRETEHVAAQGIVKAANATSVRDILQEGNACTGYGTEIFRLREQPCPLVFLCTVNLEYERD
jgi:hypothetical protein